MGKGKNGQTQTVTQKNLQQKQVIQTRTEAEITNEQEQARLQEQQREEVRQRPHWVHSLERDTQILMPTMTLTEKDISVQGEKYARKSKETIGAKKRKAYQNFSLSSLNKRKLQAEQVERAEASWQEQKEERQKAYPQLTESTTLYGDAIAAFLTEDQQRNQKLLGSDAGEECIRQFMELDLSTDFRTDQAFAEQSFKMEDISQKTEALFYLLDKHPQMDEYLSDEERAELGEKMERAKAYSDYYQIRKKVMTNSYYRSHYNSEISYRYHESDTLEQKNLTLLLWQMEELKNHPKLIDGGMKLKKRIFDYREGNADKEEVKNTRDAREILNKEERTAEGSPLVQSLAEQLEREPQNPEVLQNIKTQFQKQMNYLQRKYGNGLMLLSPQEYDQHRAEIARDFADMNQYGEFLRELKKHPDLFREKDAKDQELERLHGYYQKCLKAEKSERKGFADGSKNLSYSDYKRRVALQAARPGIELTNLIKISDSMHLDVQWSTIYDENDVKLKEVYPVFEEKNVLEKARKIQAELSAGLESKVDFTWNMFFEETKDLLPIPAIKHFLEKENRAVVEANKERWRNKLMQVEGFSSQGLGTEDFIELNQRYLAILNQEDLQRQYGMTDPEILKEYRTILDQAKDVAERMSTVECYGEAALILERESSAKFNTLPADATVTRTLYNQFGKNAKSAANQYTEQASNIRKKQLGPVYNRFIQFQEKADMWELPEHKEIVQTILEPMIQEQVPETSVQVSGQDLPLYDGSLLKELQGKQRKADVDPDALDQEIKAYNQCYARQKIFSQAMDEYQGKTQTKEVWQRMVDANMTHEKYMAYDLANRIFIYNTRLSDILKRIQDMVE